MGNPDIGARLQQARKAAKLTQKDVAEKLPVVGSIQNMSAYESGKNNPTIEALKELSKLYGVSTDYLLFGEEEKLMGDNISRSDKTSMILNELFLLCTSGKAKPHCKSECIESAESEFCANEHTFSLTFHGEPYEAKLLEDWVKFYTLYIEGRIGKAEFDILVEYAIKNNVCTLPFPLLPWEDI